MAEKNSIIFVSDVHLSPFAEGRTRGFIDFLDKIESRTAALYILGDLFDFWAGPGHATLPEHQRTLAKMKEIADSGTRIKFVYGNRDFHFNGSVCEQNGIESVGDVAQVSLNGKTALLTHGDMFCTADWKYHVTKGIIRSTPVSGLFRLLPVQWCYFLAQGYRNLSKRAVKKKPRRVVSFATEPFRRIYENGIDIVICGHVHLAGLRRLQLNGRDGLLDTLADWSDGCSYLEYCDGEMHFSQ